MRRPAAALLARALQQRYGLDDPADAAFQQYLQNLLQGDVGWSIQP